jgi:hypothetical protein
MSEKVIVAQLVDKFPTFYGTRRPVTVLTRVHQWACSDSGESSPHSYLFSRSISRCSSRSSVSEEHVIGRFMFVCSVFRKNGTGGPIVGIHLRNNGLGSHQWNNDLNDVAWRIPFDCQCTPKSRPFQNYQLLECNFHDSRSLVLAQWTVLTRTTPSMHI